MEGNEAKNLEIKRLTPVAFEPASPLREATTGFEPVIRVLQTLALPLGHVAIIKMTDRKQPAAFSHLPSAISDIESGQRDSNS